MVQVGKSTPGSFGKPNLEAQQKPKQEEQKEAPKSEQQEDGEEAIKGNEDYFTKLGISFTDDDFTKLLFNGTFEAPLEIRPGLKVKLRTLQAADYNELDEKIANMAKDTAMTEEGYRARFTMLVLSYGLLQINGKEVVRPKANQKLSNSEMADLRYEMLSNMAPAVINAISGKHNLLTTAINIVVGDSKHYLKNS